MVFLWGLPVAYAKGRPAEDRPTDECPMFHALLPLLGPAILAGRRRRGPFAIPGLRPDPVPRHAQLAALAASGRRAWRRCWWSCRGRDPSVLIGFLGDRAVGPAGRGQRDDACPGQLHRLDSLSAVLGHLHGRRSRQGAIHRLDGTTAGPGAAAWSCRQPGAASGRLDRPPAWPFAPADCVLIPSRRTARGPRAEGGSSPGAGEAPWPWRAAAW